VTACLRRSEAPASRRQAAAPPVGDATVKAATGRDWAEWVAALDRSGAGAKQHPEIVALVGTLGCAKPWWRQMVTVGYERIKGLRATHQKAAGFAVSVSRTLAVDRATLYAAWEPGERKRWLDARFSVTKATAGKSIRITWPDGSRVAVGFQEKPGGKAQVALQHERLKDAAAVARQKAFWSAALDRLAAILRPRRAARPGQ